MPLSEKVRIEIYLPDLPNQPQYQNFLDTLRRELTWAFGGCSVIRGVQGTYRALAGLLIEDRINVLYTDASLSIETDFDLISQYIDMLQETVSETLNEEAILITVSKIYWAG